MSAPTKNQIIIKVFVGFQYTIDLKMQLTQKSEWKQASVAKEKDTENLSVVRYNDSEYIGKYFDYSMLTMKDIRENAKEVKMLLRNFVPEYDVDTLKINLFPQVFVS